MRRTVALLAVTAALAGCGAPGVVTKDDRGLASTNIPVVTNANYVFDAAAPGGSLLPGEMQRLDGWFQGLGLGYGDQIFVDGAYGGPARGQVAQAAGRYGMMVEDGVPVTSGFVQPGSVRVVVSRHRAVVPGCPDWSGADKVNYENRPLPGYGCAVNGNLAAMIANPDDLLHGREGTGVGDATTASKALDYYRSAPPTATGGLKDVNTKKGQ